MLHGPRGEDGVIGALARLADVACVGSGLASSAVCLDKTLTRDVLDARGIAQTRWLGVYPGDRVPTYDEAADRLGSTVLYIKPANLGSSIGISRVADVLGWDAAISHAASYDDTLIIEAGVEGRELSVSILGDRADGYEVSEVSETRPHGEFLDHADKYGAGAAMARVPADLGPALRERVRDSAPDVAAALRVDGLARVDVFLTEDGALLVNEVNTMPGFTTESTFPRMWAASGVAFPQVLDRLCAMAVDRHERSRALIDTDIEPVGSSIRVRAATEADWRVIGELTVAAYASIPGRPRLAEYDRELADVAARADECTLLVAEDADGFVVGAVGYDRIPAPTARWAGPVRCRSVRRPAVGASVEHWSRRSWLACAPRGSPRWLSGPRTTWPALRRCTCRWAFVARPNGTRRRTTAPTSWVSIATCRGHPTHWAAPSPKSGARTTVRRSFQLPSWPISSIQARSREPGARSGGRFSSRVGRSARPRPRRSHRRGCP
ncbi:MAG: hypothetical protein IPF88_14200 [Candidatus Microthrix sp.]|nr:hypothetical protein [Candidatus Microthrix sp.]